MNSKVLSILSIGTIVFSIIACFGALKVQTDVKALTAQRDSLQLVVDTLYQNAIQTNQAVISLTANDKNLKYWLLPITSDYIRQTEFQTPDYFLKNVGDTTLYNTFQGKIYPSLGEWQKVIKYLNDKADQAAANAGK